MGARLVILAIDDDAAILYTLEAIAELAGWELVKARNAEEAFSVWMKHRPDLVLVDYHLPGMDGVTLVKKLRAVDGAVPIVVLTVDDRHELAARFRAAGATDFALKPIKAPDLISRLELNLKLSSFQRSQVVEKGISSETMDLVLHYLEKQTEPQTLNQIAAGTGLAYPTVHRYLSHLQNLGLVSSSDDYGKVGRPRKRYRLKKIFP